MGVGCTGVNVCCEDSPWESLTGTSLSDWRTQECRVLSLRESKSEKNLKMKKGSNAEPTLEGAICIFDKALPLTGLQTKAKDGQFIPRRENLTSTFHHKLSAELTVGL